MISLYRGLVAEDSAKHDGREKSPAITDFEHPARNDILAINQFRVDVTGGKTFISPNIVLFVNGIPSWLWNVTYFNRYTYD